MHAHESRMHAFMHTCTYARPYAIMYLCPYVSVYDARRQARTHTHTYAYIHAHAFTFWCMLALCMYLPLSVYTCMSEQAAHLRTLIRVQSAHMRTLIWIFTVLIRYTGFFVIWAVSHEKGTIAYADYKGSEQSAVCSSCSGLIALWSVFLV